MDYLAFQKELSMGIVTDAYLFVVQDDYIAGSYLNLIKSKMDFGGAELINTSEFNSEQTDITLLSQTLSSLPVMCEKRLVVIKKNDIGKDKALCSYLCSYLKNPCPTTVLIIYTSAVDKRTSLYQAFSSSFKIVEFERLKGKALGTWIENTFKKSGYTIENDALMYFTRAMDFDWKDNTAERVDLGYVARQIEKICSYMTKGKKINLEIVKKIASFSLNPDIFSYTDALCAMDAKKAFSELDRLVYNKEAPQKIIAAAASMMRRVALCGYLAQNGESEAEIAKSRSIHPFAVKKAVAAAKVYTPQAAMKAISELSMADRMIKNGKLNGNDALYIISADIIKKEFRLMKGRGGELLEEHIFR